MGHLRKTKTSRRVKRTKTDKRNNTQKRRQNQTFRKNRRISGGNGTGKRRAEEMHDYEKTLIDAEKDQNNIMPQNANKKSKTGKNAYREPLGEGRGPVIKVDPTKQVKITETQRGLMDDIDAEEVPGSEEGGIWFGGKKKRAIHKNKPV
jgi:hypothetical protein